MHPPPKPIPALALTAIVLILAALPAPAEPLAPGPEHSNPPAAEVSRKQPVAATSFLRYGNRAIVQMPPVPQGIFSLWFEERKLPPLDDTVLRKAAALTALPANAGVIPVDLPPPDAKPPAADKPVKVYILSGQSNMVGFGAIKPAGPQYAKILLSADPTAQPASLPIGSAALLKHGVHDATASVYQGACDPTADYSKMKPAITENVALGDTTATLPAIDGPHTVVVNAFIEVPFDGNYELHAGFESSSHCLAELAGKEAYRKGDDGKVILTKTALKKGRRHPLRITYLKGGSAALWLEQVDLKGFGDLGHVVNELGRFRYLLAEDGSWVKRTDVFLNDAYLGKGQSAPHGVDACGPTFGPELGFGFVMGTFHDEPVIVLKADIGNRSLGWDMLPPGSLGYEFEGKKYPGHGEMLDPEGNITKPGPDDWYAGKQYDDYTTAIRAVLDNFGERYPQFKGQGYEVAGFVWWQATRTAAAPRTSPAMRKTWSISSRPGARSSTRPMPRGPSPRSDSTARTCRKTKEVLLMRQTFEVPKLDANHRYRIVVGGAGHAWSGEGFALYLNGKLVSEATGGYYKSGGQTRGALILNELLPEFESGKVTIAVKGFLRRNGHRNKAAAPSGHLSVWMESARLSPFAEMIVETLKP